MSHDASHRYAYALSLLQAEPWRHVATLARTLTELGIRERGRNQGPWISGIVEHGGTLDDEDGHAWCALLGIWVWDVGLASCGMRRTCQLSGSVARTWHLTPERQRLTRAQLVAAAGQGVCLLRPGDLILRATSAEDAAAVRERGSVRPGHLEIVIRQHATGPTLIDAVGGNTDASAGREGDGIYYRPGGWDLRDGRIIGTVRPTYTRALP